jgi:hypothetical protein
MTPLIAGGAGVLAILGVVFLAWRFGKSAGASQQQADSSSASLKVETKMGQAGANAPKTLQDVAAAARRGEF